jgi:hypothetical protein
VISQFIKIDEFIQDTFYFSGRIDHHSRITSVFAESVMSAMAEKQEA